MLRPHVHQQPTAAAATRAPPRTYDEMLVERAEHTASRRALAEVAARAGAGGTLDGDDGGRRVGCFAGLLRRLRGGAAPRASAGSAATMIAAAARRVFRSRSEQSAARLDDAESRLSQRVTELEERVALARDEARLRMQSKQKPAALRALKRAKALEHSLAQTNAALVAVERQRDLLEEAKLHRTVTGAIGTSMVSLKKACGSTSLASAEQAIDDAAEAHDQLQEIADAVGQFGASAAASAGADDDDELMAELELMVADDETVHGAAASQSTNTPDAAAVAFPSAPRRRTRGKGYQELQEGEGGEHQALQMDVDL